MSKNKLLYEGKAKQLFTTDKDDQLIQFFKDDATAFNKKKHEQSYPLLFGIAHKFL